MFGISTVDTAGVAVFEAVQDHVVGVSTPEASSLFAALVTRHLAAAADRDLGLRLEFCGGVRCVGVPDYFIRKDRVGSSLVREDDEECGCVEPRDNLPDGYRPNRDIVPQDI